MMTDFKKICSAPLIALMATMVFSGASVPKAGAFTDGLSGNIVNDLINPSPSAQMRNEFRGIYDDSKKTKKPPYESEQERRMHEAEKLHDAKKEKSTIYRFVADPYHPPERITEVFPNQNIVSLDNNREIAHFQQCREDFLNGRDKMPMREAGDVIHCANHKVWQDSQDNLDTFKKTFLMGAVGYLGFLTWRKYKESAPKPS